MKKKIKNMRYGFTIAELLITMFIAMIVAAAMVPLIGPKKIKFPEFNKVHGIYACYWDNEDNLQAYYADTKQKAPYNTGDLVQGNYCTFPAQASADHFEIYAISSGSPGFYNNSDYENSIKPVVSKSSSPINQGDISLENYSKDIDAITAKVDDELYTVLDDKNKKISLKDMVKKTITDWNEKGEGNNKPYAVITALNTALGRGGGGIARKFTVDKTAKIGGGYTECTVDAQEDPQQMFRPNKGFTMAQTDKTGAGAVSAFKQIITMNGKCYGYLHAAGSDSRRGLELKPGYRVLIPITGDSFRISTTKDYLDSYMTVLFNLSGTDISHGIQVVSVPEAGHDAYYDADNNQFKVEEITQTPIDNSVNVYSNETVGKIRFMDNSNNVHFFNDSGSNKQALNATEDTSLAFREVVNKGTEHGIEVNEGKICYKLNGVCQDRPDDVQRGVSASYMNEGAFTWSQNGIEATINYVKAGKSGNEVVYRASDLGGNRLYLFPSRDNKTSTVVSKVNDISDTNTKEYVVSAPAIENSIIGGGKDSYGPYLLNQSQLPYPFEEIVNKTIPNNNNLTYVNAIRSSRFKNALGLICNDTLDVYGSTLSSCPGYGGAGAYPLLSRFDRSFEVQVRNNQDGIKGTDFESFTHRFNDGMMYDYREENGKQGQNIKCRNEGDSFVLNEVDVCRGSRQQRGRGAVIILW